MTLMKRRRSLAKKKVCTTMGRLATFVLVCLSAASLLLVAEFALGIKLSPEGRDKYFWSGDQFVITCQNNNNIKNVRIRLIGPNDQEITTDRSHRIHTLPNLPSGNRLVVMNASVADSGRYRCTIGSAGDKISFKEDIEFSINIYRNLDFHETPNELILPIGKQGTLTCHVSADPNVNLMVSWTKDGVTLANAPNQTNYRVVEEGGSTDFRSRIMLNNVQKEDAGEYRCIVASENDKLSKIVSWPILLKTSFAPQFKEKAHIQWIERSLIEARQQSTGGSGRNGANSRSRNNNNNNNRQQLRVELKCECEANPAAEILWTKRGSTKVVLEKANPEYILDINQTVDRYNTSSILVLDYNYNQSEEYICIAKNPLGTAEKNYLVKQGDPPPAFKVESNPVLEITGSSLTFRLLEPVGLPSGQEIEPPVDGFRIRAESPKTSDLPGQIQDNSGNIQTVIQQLQRRQEEDPSVFVQIPSSSEEPAPLSQLLRKNYTVNIGKLPGGPQRLFLDAHNAVGWSAKSTYLGEYNIVNSASLAGSGLANTLLFSCLVILLTSHLNLALSLSF